MLRARPEKRFRGFAALGRTFVSIAGRNPMYNGAFSQGTAPTTTQRSTLGLVCEKPGQQSSEPRQPKGFEPEVLMAMTFGDVGVAGAQEACADQLITTGVLDFCGA